MKTAALWLAAIAVALLLAYVGPIDDGAQVIADDKNEVIAAAAARKD
jgi:hypothetical protein